MSDSKNADKNEDSQDFDFSPIPLLKHISDNLFIGTLFWKFGELSKFEIMGRNFRSFTEFRKFYPKL